MPRKPHDTEELVTAVGQLVRRLRAERNAYGLGLGEKSVVGHLARGGPSTIADLARAENIKPQSMGATVAALETAGIVARKSHPTDGRQVLIELTAQGIALRKEIRAARQAWLQQAIDRLAPGERDTLYAAGALIARLAQS